MRATVKDVAHRAGVSPKTVSNVINGTFPVTEATRARVEEALVELDYVPNLSARGLRNGRTGLIALALPDLGTPYSAEMTHHLVAAAARHGLGVQIEETSAGDERERTLLSRARAQLIDGLILNPVRRETTAVQPGLPLPPVVLIGEVDQPIADHVWVDNVAASAELTALLIEQGHRRIAVLGVHRSDSARLRLRGHEQALRTAGLRTQPDLQIPADDWTPAGGAAAVRGYLASHDLPDAIVGFTDSLALGAISALWSLGLRVPDDCSVVGFDDVAAGEYAAPPLTTVHFDKRAFAETVLRLLVARIADPGRAVEQVTLPHRIVCRASHRPRS